MAGKKHDQYQIDPVKAGATDHKTRTERAEDEVAAADDDARVESNQSEPETEGHIPVTRDNPALAKLKQSKDAKRTPR
ncbi:MAG: hypothetical protein M3068_06155 [Gemmatimonadota bacterium]|nr:hypothetical protein [Gemmatimonadota bacterium]